MSSTALPLRRHEFSPYGGGRTEALAKVIEDITAAAHLNVPFTVTTVHSKHFRNGGNVNKADVREYVVEFGKPVIEE